MKLCESLHANMYSFPDGQVLRQAEKEELVKKKTEFAAVSQLASTA